MENHKCFFQEEKPTGKIIEDIKAKPCKLICPVNLKKICYRWDICLIGKSEVKKRLKSQ